MNTGRRSFLKMLGGVIGGLTVAGRMKAQEEKKAKEYAETFRKNSLETLKDYKYGGNESGVCFPVSGRYIPYAFCITGSYQPVSGYEKL